jgi:DNA replication ATP-dependent helicase Dna2
MKTLSLRDGWVETPVSKGHYVHVIGKFEGNTCIIDDVQHMLILHPDNLVSSTVVADSFSCIRRAVLQDRVKATSESTAPLVYGTILHEIFQAAMMENRWDTPWLSEVIKTMCFKHLEDLYTIKVQIPQAIEHLRSKMNEMQGWAKQFISLKPNVSLRTIGPVYHC